jgi:hypothetical protein
MPRNTAATKAPRNVAIRTAAQERAKERADAAIAAHPVNAVNGQPVANNGTDNSPLPAMPVDPVMAQFQQFLAFQAMLAGQQPASPVPAQQPIATPVHPLPASAPTPAVLMGVPVERRGNVAPAAIHCPDFDQLPQHVSNDKVEVYVDEKQLDGSTKKVKKPLHLSTGRVVDWLHKYAATAYGRIQLAVLNQDGTDSGRRITLSARRSKGGGVQWGCDGKEAILYLGMTADGDAATERDADTVITAKATGLYFGAQEWHKR